MGRRLRVFVSSTMEDLANERDAVCRKLLSLRCDAVSAEALLPTGRSSWDHLRNEITSCDIFILLIGARYGQPPAAGAGAGTGKSITELEYDEARAAGIPVFPFFRHLDVGEDQDPEAQRALAFRERVAAWNDGQFRGEFRLAHDLAENVGESITQYLHERYLFYTTFFQEAEAGKDVGKTEFSSLSVGIPTGRVASHQCYDASMPAERSVAQLRVIIYNESRWPSRSDWYRGLAERLAREGHRVRYLAGSGQGSASLPPLDNKVEVVESRRSVRSGSRLLAPLVNPVLMAWDLWRYGRRCDVIHLEAARPMSLLVAGLVAGVAGNDLCVDWSAVPSLNEVREPARTLLRAAIALSAWIPQHAFCFSQDAAERLRQFGMKREPTVLSGRYRGSLETPTVSPTGAEVVFIGYLTRDRRADLAVAGFAAAASRIPDLRATFYGTGPESARLDAAIAAHGVGDKVMRVDYTDADGIETALRNAMCLLIASRGEQSSLVVVEAASRATPVVVVPVEGRSPMAFVEGERNGLIAEGEDPLSVGAAISAVYEAGTGMRESTAAWFGENAYRLSAAHAYEQICDSYIRFTKAARP